MRKLSLRAIAFAILTVSLVNSQDLRPETDKTCDLYSTGFTKPRESSRPQLSSLANASISYLAAGELAFSFFRENSKRAAELSNRENPISGPWKYHTVFVDSASCSIVRVQDWWSTASWGNLIRLDDDRFLVESNQILKVFSQAGQMEWSLPVPNGLPVDGAVFASNTGKTVFTRNRHPDGTELVQAYDAQTGKLRATLTIPVAAGEVLGTDEFTVFGHQVTTATDFVIAPLDGSPYYRVWHQEGLNGEPKAILRAGRILLRSGDHSLMLVSRHGDVIAKYDLGEEFAGDFRSTAEGHLAVGLLYKRRPARLLEEFPKTVGLRFAAFDASTLEPVSTVSAKTGKGGDRVFSWDVSPTGETIAIVTNAALRFCNLVPLGRN